MNNFKMDKRKILERISGGLQWKNKPPKLKRSILKLALQNKKRLNLHKIRILDLCGHFWISEDRMGVTTKSEAKFNRFSVATVHPDVNSRK